LVKLKCKCKGCLNREIGCHSTCTDYKEYKSEITRIKEIKRKDNIVSDYSCATCERYFNNYRVKQKFIKSKRK